LTERNDQAALDTALAAAAEVAEGPRRAELLVRRADVLTWRLDRGEDALAALDKAESAAAGDPVRAAAVLDCRARALRRLERHGPLADALAARRALLVAQKIPVRKGTPDPKIPFLREEGHLRAFALNEVVKARELLDEARKLSGDEPGVLEDLLKVERRA